MFAFNVESNDNELLLVAVPSPSCPDVLSPQANNALLAAIAKEWLTPTNILVQLVFELINTGEDLFTVVPSPNCPEEFKPQAHKEESSSLIPKKCVPFGFVAKAFQEIVPLFCGKKPVRVWGWLPT